MVGVTGDITETRQRERQLQMAQAEAAAAQRDVEQTREVMQTVLDNMTDGVTLFDKDFRWQFSNRAHIDGREYPPGFLKPGVHGRELVRFQIERGDFGDVEDVEAVLDEAEQRILQPGGNRYERRTSNGRFTEFTYKPLDDGALLGIYRDITELKERENALAAAKEVAEAARDAAERARAEANAARNEAEQTRTIMQTVLDNMSDGVMLFDSEMRWQFTNRQLVDFQRCHGRDGEAGHFRLDILRVSGASAAISVRSRNPKSPPRLIGGSTSCGPARATNAAPRAASSSSSISSRSKTAACSGSTATSRN